MKRILLLCGCLLALLPARASNDYLSQTTGSSIGDTDVILFETTSGTVYKIPASTVRTYAQTNAVLATSSYADPSWLTALSYSKLTGAPALVTSLPFSSITSTPTTVGGYGITDGVTLTGTQTLTNKSIAASEITGTFTGNAANVTGIVAVVNGGTGTTSPSLVGGTNITIAGAWPNQVISTTTGTYTLPAATTSALGGVIADGTTITISSGTISVGSVAWSAVSGKPTFPSGAIVGTSDTQTLTNKSIASSEITGVTFPGGAIVGTSDAQTLTNKSIASSEINTGTLSVVQGGLGVSSLTAYAPLFGGTGSTAAVQSGGLGTTGQVLTSNGSGALPTFQSPTSSGWSAISSSTTATVGAQLWPTASCTVTLPSAANGQTIVIEDFSGSNTAGYMAGFATNPVTVNSSYSIGFPGGSGSSVVLNRDYQQAYFTYNGGVWYEREAHPPTVVAATLSSGSVTVSSSLISATNPPTAAHKGTSVTNAGSLYLYAVSNGTSATFKSTNTSDNDTIAVTIP